MQDDYFITHSSGYLSWIRKMSVFRAELVIFVWIQNTLC